LKKRICVWVFFPNTNSVEKKQNGMHGR